MKNKTIVKIFTIAILLVVLASSASFVLGYDVDDLKPDYTGNTAVSTQGATAKVVGIVQIVGIAIAVIMLIWLGVKYVSASPNEKADVKKGAMIYVVGAVFMLGATAILQIIKKFALEVTG